jgi:hypothetical protein
MSRSYKKAFYSDQGDASHSKRQASKRIRHAKDVGDGRSYKKHYCSWDICDHKHLSEYEQNQDKNDISHSFGRTIITSVEEKQEALKKARRK